MASPVLSPEDDVRVAASHVLAIWLGAFDRELPEAREGDVEAIHRVRVAMRRLRATLALFEPVLRPDIVASLTEDLAWLGRGVGAVRDLETVADRLADLGPVVGRGALALMRRVKTDFDPHGLLNPGKLLPD